MGSEDGGRLSAQDRARARAAFKTVFSRNAQDKSGPSKSGSGLSKRKETDIERRKRTGKNMSRVKKRKKTDIERRKSKGSGGFRK